MTEQHLVHSKNNSCNAPVHAPVHIQAQALVPLFQDQSPEHVCSPQRRSKARQEQDLPSSQTHLDRQEICTSRNSTVVS